MDWIYQKFIAPIWTRYGLWAFILIAVLALAAAWLFGVDLGGWINGVLGV